MATRLCRVCNRPPREGDPMSLVRLQPGDLPPDRECWDRLPDGSPAPTGLPACAECVAEFKPKAAARLNKRVEDLTLWDLL